MNYIKKAWDEVSINDSIQLDQILILIDNLEFKLNRFILTVNQRELLLEFILDSGDERVGLTLEQVDGLLKRLLNCDLLGLVNQSCEEEVEYKQPQIESTKFKLQLKANDTNPSVQVDLLNGRIRNLHGLLDKSNSSIIKDELISCYQLLTSLNSNSKNLDRLLSAITRQDAVINKLKMKTGFHTKSNRWLRFSVLRYTLWIALAAVLLSFVLL